MRRLIVAVVVLAAAVALLSAGPLTTARSEDTVVAPAAAGTAASTWRVLLIIFRDTDAEYVGNDGRRHRMTVSLTQSNIDALLASLNGPVSHDVRDWSNGAVQWDVTVKYSPRTLTSLSAPDADGYQDVNPSTIRDVIDGFSPDGAYDQIMVYWAADKGTESIPHRGWGLAFGYSPSTPWCFLTVEQAPTESWNSTVADNSTQVWIHEWLHCASSYYAALGFPMPTYDADGAAYHGYATDQAGLPWNGAYYSDLMQGKVLENGKRVGITRDAWLAGSPRMGFPSSYASWTGEYFANQSLTGSAVAHRADGAIDFDWGLGSPMAGLPADNFSARWTANVSLEGGTYRFSTLTDDGVRLYVDGMLVIDSWVDQGGVTHTAERWLSAGSHAVRMEYYENGGAAVARMWWVRLSGSAPSTTTTSSTSTTSTTLRLPGARFVDVSASHPYRIAIEEMGRLNIVAGYPQPNGTVLFKPGSRLLRAQFAKVVCGVFDLPVEESLVATFTDMGLDSPGDLYPHDYVAAAAAAGIIQGTSRSDFAPWDDVTRAQMITMVVRAAQNRAPGVLATPPDSFVGTKGDFYPTHGENLRIAEYNGLLNGLQDFGPSWDPWQPATRGEVAQVLWNAMRLRD